MRLFFGLFIFLLWAVPPRVLAETWHDPLYSFRAPLKVQVPAAGEYRLSLTAADITDWLNRQSDFRFKPRYFDHNGLVLVELDDEGRETGQVADAGFHLYVGREMVENGDFSQHEDSRARAWHQTHPGFLLRQGDDGKNYIEVEEGADRQNIRQMVEVEPHTWYRYSQRLRGSAAAAPLFYYRELNNWLPPARSYFDPYTPSEGWYQQQYFFYTGAMNDWAGDLRVGMERFIGAFTDVSLRECRVDFILRTDSGGSKRYMLYYAPLEGTTPAPPKRQTAAAPEHFLPVWLDGEVEWLDEDITYLLVSQAAHDIWHAASTRTVREDTLAPAVKRERITIAAARRESEAFQIVFRPRATGEIRSVRAHLAGPEGRQFTDEQFDVRQAQYVTIHQPSRTGIYYSERSRSEFSGRLPDPLPKFAPVAFKRGDANILLWIDVSVPADAPAGVYQGAVVLELDSGEIELPLELTVWDFTLPEVMSCRGSFQFGQYANQFLFPFHKVETKEDKYALSRAYIAAMARYRFPAADPQSAGTLYPGENYVAGAMSLDEQIESLERELAWAFEELNMNGARVGHVSGWGPHIENPDNALKDAERFDAIAEMLTRRGWADRCFIMIDEPIARSYPAVRHWVQTLKKQPHAGRLKILICVYHGYSYDKLRDIADILVPINNDYGCVVSEQAFSEHYSDEREAWFYWTNSSHIWIDSPAINHRLWAPKVWAFGGRGMLQWATAQWWTLPMNSQHHIENPWVNPLTTWGNGALAFFYPPNPLGRDLPEKDMTIVPSLRLLLAREGIEDFEYAVILERLIKEAQAAGHDTAQAETAVADARAQFETPKSWRLSETYWLRARAKMATAIVDLQKLSTDSVQ